MMWVFSLRDIHTNDILPNFFFFLLTLTVNPDKEWVD